MQDPNNQTMQEKILGAIKTGELKPRSKWYFYAQSAILALGLVFTGLLILFVGSLIIFSLRQNGAWFAPGFGFYGIKIFFMSLPWLLILTVAILLILLETLFRRYKFAYQQPLLYSFVALTLVFSAGALFVSRIRVHENLFEQSRQKNLMLGSPVYRHYGMPNGQITKGQIVQITPDGCNIQTLTETNLKVLISKTTKMHNKYQLIIGDAIIVLGPREGNTIQAFGIKPTSEFYGNMMRKMTPEMIQ